jgi:hypothetical protein
VPQVSGNALARQNMLFHISEEANINSFEPRPSEYTSEPVVCHRRLLPDPVSELRRRGVELRVLPNLWPLRDVVIASSLQFSIIRMRNALPRKAT